MSRRKRVVLIALVWTVAGVLCVLPLLWPAYMHLIGTRIYRDYELEAAGVVTGWVTRDVLGRCRRRG